MNAERAESMYTVSEVSERARARGPKPMPIDARLERVKIALEELKEAGAPFTVLDVAERSGMSRATIYRSTELRSLIGVRGEPSRAVPRIAHLRLLTSHQELKRQLRELRRDLDSAEERYERMRSRLQAAEDKNRRSDDVGATSDQLAAAARSLRSTASRLGADECRRARRQIARVLHPDLFPSSSAAHDLALELLKSLNALID